MGMEQEQAARIFQSCHMVGRHYLYIICMIFILFVFMLFVSYGKWTLFVNILSYGGWTSFVKCWAEHCIIWHYFPHSKHFQRSSAFQSVHNWIVKLAGGSWENEPGGVQENSSQVKSDNCRMFLKLLRVVMINIPDKCLFILKFKNEFAQAPPTRQLSQRTQWLIQQNLKCQWWKIVENIFMQSNQILVSCCPKY